MLHRSFSYVIRNVIQVNQSGAYSLQSQSLSPSLWRARPRIVRCHASQHIFYISSASNVPIWFMYTFIFKYTRICLQWSLANISRIHMAEYVFDDHILHFNVAAFRLIDLSQFVCTIWIQAFAIRVTTYLCSNWWTIPGKMVICIVCGWVSECLCLHKEYAEPKHLTQKPHMNCFLMQNVSVCLNWFRQTSAPSSVLLRNHIS